MNELVVKRIDADGASSLFDVSLGSVNLQSKGYFVNTRSTAELKLLVRMKARYPLEGIEGGFTDLPTAPKAFSVLKPSPVQQEVRQETFEGKSVRDPFTEFRINSLLLANSRMEYFYLYREPIDKVLRKGYAEIKGAMDYLDTYRSKVDGLEKNTQASKQDVRRSLHHDWFFTEDERKIKRRDAMLGELMRLQKATDVFEYAVPACPLIDDEDYQQTAAEDINDACQGIAYALNMSSASYFMYTKKALKDRKLMNRYFDYIERKGRRLNIVNFSELNLHCPPDKRARMEFAEFGKRITALQDEPEHKKKLFMLTGAGNQAFIAMEAFDFVSTSPTRIDKLIGWSHGRKLGFWLDERLMMPFPPEDCTIDNAHCPRCQLMRDLDLSDPRENGWRREHGIHDLNNLSTGFRNHIRSKDIGVYLRQKLAASECSGFQMMIQSP